ncbi:GGDEF domain-containing protein [Chitiniphilus shinanonensis]|uniref:diguanylate cyclase n=1 Tax=Chitiniphilus shinanonensis TaxID=553088 RepID=A0ABQ6BNX4_9NEIS|nr:diguanylate cyclase [Chitiniphilus shinanonensis]GLS03546.1 GGDEF domain-containing protein [Chitiniphilus shinanonensis]
MRTLSGDLKFKAGSLLILAIASLLAGQLVWSHYQDYRRNLDNLDNLRLYHSALLATNLLSAERGPANNLLGTPQASNGARALQLAMARAASDGALAELARLLTLHPPLPFQPKHQLDQLQQSLREARAQVDHLAMLPLSQRSNSAISQAIEHMFQAVDRLEAVVTVIGNHAAKADRSLSDAILMAQVVSNMREYAGRVGSLLIGPLVHQQPFSIEELRRITNLRGRLEEMNMQLNHQIGDYWDRPGMLQARDRVTQQYFGAGNAIVQSVLRQRDSGRYSDNAVSFTERYVPTMLPIEQLRDRIIDSSGEQVARDLDIARRGMLLATLLACGIAGSIGSLLYFARHRLLMPLLHARKEIIDLANGNCQQPRRPRSGQEVRELFDAIDILRIHQQQRDLLEKRLSAMTRQFKRQAETDALTGVSNRRALEELGEQLVLDAALGGWQMGLLLFDIDHFKQVNDLHGHPAGDEVLRAVAQRVRMACRGEDNIGRFGGEEFTVLIPRTDTTAAHLLAEKLRQLIADTPIVLADGKALSITASFGIAVSHADCTWAKLVATSDRALYAAKRNGRNRVESTA